jgi:hypothetical protein
MTTFCVACVRCSFRSAINALRRLCLLFAVTLLMLKRHAGQRGKYLANVKNAGYISAAVLAVACAFSPANAAARVAQRKYAMA